MVCVNLPGLAVRHDGAEVDRSGDGQAIRLALPVADHRGHGRVAEARPRAPRHHPSSRDCRRLARRDAGADVGGAVPRGADAIIAMASGAAVPVTGIAWHILGRKIIETDQRFHGGDYYDEPEPLRGLEVARMLGHMTYLSRARAAAEVWPAPARQHAAVRDRLVLRVPGKEVRRALRRELVHPRAGGDGRDGSRGAVRVSPGRVCALARPHAADLLRYRLALPSRRKERVAAAMRASARGPPREIPSANGHDTFLIDFHLIGDLVRDFLART